MKTLRNTLIGAILTLGAAGSIWVGSAAPAVAATTSSAHVAGTYTPNTHYYG